MRGKKMYAKQRNLSVIILPIYILEKFDQRSNDDPDSSKHTMH